MKTQPSRKSFIVRNFSTLSICGVLLTLVVAGLMYPHVATTNSDQHLATSSEETCAGLLDTTFGGTGIVATSQGFVFSVIIQSDGKIIAAGQTWRNGVDTFGDTLLNRFNIDGSLDTTFGAGGVVITQVGVGSVEDDARAIALQPDGKIVTAGTIGSVGGPFEYSVARHNSDGSLDTAFGDGGKVITTGNRGIAESVAIQQDGKIVVVGNGGVMRFGSNGTLDTTFGGTGIINFTFLRSVAIQTDGKIVAGGSTGDFAIVRFNSDGTLDTTFDGDGFVLTPIGSGYDGASSIAVQQDGKIVAFGNSNNGTDWDFALVRYNSNGSLDTSFDVDGIVTTNVGSFDIVSGSTSMKIQSDGKIIVTGFGPPAAVIRYNSNGSLDTTFGNTGIVTGNLDV